MSNPNKDCAACVYSGPCEGRLLDSTIEDCCIPVAPLRELQANAKDALQFASVTQNYIQAKKKNSKYWCPRIVEY
jgi:hypothetical protein